uniref:HTH psq-type domain-containing protein n=1 Tax=Heliothis virescens TaxID=7102 RepID=A0A2A4J5Z3_HELVI
MHTAPLSAHATLRVKRRARAATMPRNYIRKTAPKYEIKDLRHALEDVKNKKLTLSQAATKFSIPKTTLFKQLKLDKYKIPKKGKHSVFNKEQEEQLTASLV